MASRCLVSICAFKRAIGQNPNKGKSGADFKNTLEVEIVQASILGIFFGAVRAKSIYINTCERPIPILFLFFTRIILRKNVLVCVHNADFFFPKLSKSWSKRWFIALAHRMIGATRYYTISPILRRNLGRRQNIWVELLPVSNLAKVVMAKESDSAVVIGEIVPWRKNVDQLLSIDFGSLFSGDFGFKVCGNIDNFEGPKLQKHVERSSAHAIFFHRFIPLREFLSNCRGASYFLQFPLDTSGYEQVKSTATVFYARAFDIPLLLGYQTKFILIVGEKIYFRSDINDAIRTMHLLLANCEKGSRPRQCLSGTGSLSIAQVQD